MLIFPGSSQTTPVQDTEPSLPLSEMSSSSQPASNSVNLTNGSDGSVADENQPSAPTENGNLANDLSVQKAKTIDEIVQMPASVANDIVTPDQTLEAALQEAARAEAESAESDGMDNEIFYSPNLTQVVPASMSSPQGVQNRSPSYSPALERSVPAVPESTVQAVDETGGKSYSPALERVVAIVTDQAMVDISPSVPARPIVQEGESDDYEPAEAASPIENSPPFSPAPPQNPISNGTGSQGEEVRDDGEITDEAEDVFMTNGVDPINDESEISVSAEQDDTEAVQSQSVRKLSLSNDDIEAEGILPQTNGSVPLLIQVKSMLLNPFA